MRRLKKGKKNLDMKYELSTFTITGVCVTHYHIRMGQRTEHSILHTHTHTHRTQTIHTINASCLPLIRAQFSGRRDALVVGGERERASISRLLKNLPAGEEKHLFISGSRYEAACLPGGGCD